MIFNSLEDVPAKLTLLKQVCCLYYFPPNEVIMSSEIQGSIVLTDREMKTLVSFYRKVNYCTFKMSCESCKETKLRQIQIEFNKFLNDIKDIYGGQR